MAAITDRLPLGLFLWILLAIAGTGVIWAQFVERSESSRGPTTLMSVFNGSNEAAWRGYVRKIEAEGKINAVTNWGATPLSCAAMLGREEIVVALLDLGASPNTPTPQGCPLSLAVRTGNHRLVERLVAAGADVDSVSRELAAGDPVMQAVLQPRQ